MSLDMIFNESKPKNTEGQTPLATQGHGQLAPQGQTLCCQVSTYHTIEYSKWHSKWLRDGITANYNHLCHLIYKYTQNPIL